MRPSAWSRSPAPISTGARRNRLFQRNAGLKAQPLRFALAVDAHGEAQGLQYAALLLVVERRQLLRKRLAPHLDRRELLMCALPALAAREDRVLLSKQLRPLGLQLGQLSRERRADGGRVLTGERVDQVVLAPLDIRDGAGDRGEIPRCGIVRRQPFQMLSHAFRPRQRLLDAGPCGLIQRVHHHSMVGAGSRREFATLTAVEGATVSGSQHRERPPAVAAAGEAAAEYGFLRLVVVAAGLKLIEPQDPLHVVKLAAADERRHDAGRQGDRHGALGRALRAAAQGNRLAGVGGVLQDAVDGGAVPVRLAGWGGSAARAQSTGDAEQCRTRGRLTVDAADHGGGGFVRRQCRLRFVSPPVAVQHLAAVQRPAGLYARHLAAPRAFLELG